MCYHIAIHITREELQERFQVDFSPKLRHEPRYHVSAFSLPFVPIIPSETPDLAIISQWGLIPYWSKDRAFADQIRIKTFNARIEEILEKPSYKTPIKRSRCLVPARGFFEHHTHQGKKYPFYISLKNKKIFAFAGIYDQWMDKSTGELLHTFSILTTAANPMMEKIHNEKKRMPVILSEENEKRWLDISVTPDALLCGIQKDFTDALDAYPVSKRIYERGADTNTPKTITPFKYSELDHFRV